MRQRCLRILLAILLPFWAVQSAGATTVRSFSTEQLTLGAELIIEGHCVHLETAWMDGILMTLATVEVDAVHKGQPGATVTVVTPGGVDLDREVPIQMVVAGSPAIAPQEEVLLFLVPFTGTPDAFTVLGLAQGKYTLAVTEGGVKRASSDLRGLQRTPPLPTPSNSPDLEGLRAEIAGYLATAGTPPPS